MKESVTLVSTSSILLIRLVDFGLSRLPWTSLPCIALKHYQKVRKSFSNWAQTIVQ